MTARVLSSLIGTLLLLVLTIAPAQAQNWKQEVQIITTVDYDEPLQVFTDSLIAVLERNPNVLLRREAEEPTMRARQLREQLYQDGIDVNSASHALIRYQFELQRGSEIVETIKDIYLIYRGSESQADIPILYLDPGHPLIHNLISNQGIPSLVNMEVVNTFRETFAFPYLTERQETAMVEIAGRPLRGYTVTPEQRILEDFLTQHMNIGGGSYVLALPEPTVMASTNAPPSTDSSAVKVTAVPEEE